MRIVVYICNLIVKVRTGRRAFCTLVFAFKKCPLQQSRASNCCNVNGCVFFSNTASVLLSQKMLLFLNILSFF